MKKVAKLMSSCFLLLSIVALVSCKSGSNPVINLDDPSTFPGTYEMKSMTFKTGDADAGFPPGTTVEGGKQTTFSYTDDDTGISFNAQVKVTMTMILTADRYTQTSKIEISIPGFQIPSETTTEMGSYSLQGNQLTVTPDDPDEGESVLTVSASGSEMTVEDAEVKMVLRKTK